MSLKSVYKILFGAHGPLPGNVIDMSEHGRAGGDKDSQGFKYTSDIEETSLIHEATGKVYFGWATPGSNTTEGKADARWKIKCIDESVADNTTVGWADGDTAYNNIWDDRESLSYS
jgi:hypothetical protein